MKIRLKKPGWVDFRDMFLFMALQMAAIMIPISFILSYGVAVLYLHDNGLIGDYGRDDSDIMFWPPVIFVLCTFLAFLSQAMIHLKNKKNGLR